MARASFALAPSAVAVAVVVCRRHRSTFIILRCGERLAYSQQRLAA
jgi:hypothetical protein